MRWWHSGSCLATGWAAQIEKSPEGLMLYLGAIRAGAVFLPLNTAYTVGELDYFLRDAEPKVFVCDSARHQAIADIAKGCGVAAVETLGADGRGSLFDLAQAQPGTCAAIPRGPEDLAAILYTSGTTDAPKAPC